MEQQFVDIWSGRLTLAPETLQTLYAILDDSERQKAQTFKSGLMRDRFIAVRSLLRQTLAHYLKVQPAGLQFDIGEYGKPFLACGSLHFNLSHTGDYMLIAVANFPDIGVDIEKLIQRSSLDAIAKRVFSEGELKLWRQLAPEQQLTGFYRLWTKKEAFVKAVGRGIALGMELCEFELEQGGQLIAIPAEYEPVCDWRVTELEVFCGLSAALVAKSRDFTLRQCEIAIRE